MCTFWPSFPKIRTWGPDWVGNLLIISAVWSVYG